MTRFQIPARAGAVAITASVGLLLPVSVQAQRTASTTASAPSGWVGISLIQNGRSDGESGVAMEYPVIASVEPGSPAQVAGLTAGDTVISFNDSDAHANPMGFQRFLTPGERIVVKVRRNGVREIPLTVARRTAKNSYRMGVTVDAAQMAAAIPAMISIGGPIPIAGPFATRRGSALAGAQLARLNPGLANVLNVRDAGVLVVDVAEGTPALRSGLTAGDVIVRADSITVLGPIELMRAMREASGRSVLLDVLRKGKPQKITLQW